MSAASLSVINRHVKAIEAALANTRTAFFQLIEAIRDARDELGAEVMQSELSERLGIPASTLSKYLQIADCQLIMKKQKFLPPALTTLYSLAQTHTTLVKAMGGTKADENFRKILDKVDKTSEANDVALFLKKAKEKLNKKGKGNRERNLLSLSSSEIDEASTWNELVSLDEVSRSNKKFRTIFIDPPQNVMKWASKNEVFASDIAEKYPIADLRPPSTKTTVQGFVYCPANQINGGLKFISAAGFEYRDMFCPTTDGEGFSLLNNEKVLLRGERGVASRPTLNGEVESGIAGALAIAELMGSGPRLYVFATEEYDGWTCAK